MAGRKLFGREVLASADVQDFLMDQTVMRFASANARDTALPQPANGTVAWLDNPGVFTERLAGAWVVRTAQSINGGTSGVIVGTAPPAGTALIRKYVAGTFSSSSFGDMTVTYPGGAFPNGLVGINATAVTNLGYKWAPWNSTLSTSAMRLTAGTAVQASTSLLSAFEFIGW